MPLQVQNAEFRVLSDNSALSALHSELIMPQFLQGSPDSQILFLHHI